MKLTLGTVVQVALTLLLAVPIYYALDPLFAGRLASYIQVPAALFWGFVVMCLVMAVYIRVRFGAEAFRNSRAPWS